ncbi:uncharacterized protein LOC121730216 isoform X2 [Aricia agestis]|uniref:uncharacterized protein LOC121730216 isoform X2 n=1 Tax=Aricia agestis TaxID=91739 RepID=UPI001C207F3D|nr:uncharacterized protein LOC121730216 isoform X2 [Aricia agestis]
MFIILSTFLVICVNGNNGARPAHIDINRIKILANEVPAPPSHYRRSLSTNDYDDHSGRHPLLYPPLPQASEAKAEAEALKIHQPKEDPKLYYQSEAYLKEINQKNYVNDVSHVYPGREVIRANEAPLPLMKHDMRRLLRQGSELCIKCPSDRTLVAKPGSDRVRVMHPHLTTCLGRKAPKSVRFEHIYGPRYGSLVKEGTHIIVGRIMHKQDVLQRCKMVIHVIVQSCPVPKYLKLHCSEHNSTCQFSCRNRTLELHGASQLRCNEEDKKWNGILPTCSAPKGCRPLPPPDQGHVSCKGNTDELSWLKEGSRCRLRCPAGWRWFPRSVAICRRGKWTNSLQCQPKHKRY